MKVFYLFRNLKECEMETVKSVESIPIEEQMLVRDISNLIIKYFDETGKDFVTADYNFKNVRIRFLCRALITDS